MGKENFQEFYEQIEEEMLSNYGEVTVKISHYSSDKFNPKKNYAGAIIYAIDGEFEWLNEKGKASGWWGRSFYVIIQCTDNWPAYAFGRAGKGMVHDYLIEDIFGIAHSDEINGKKRICCGGFGYRDGHLKFSSIWLNQTNQMGCDNDGSKYLSDAERVLIRYCFEQRKEHGERHVFEIPNWLSDQLSGRQCLQEVPSKEGCWI
jgi:hypothetical protein